MRLARFSSFSHVIETSSIKYLWNATTAIMLFISVSFLYYIWFRRDSISLKYSQIDFVVSLLINVNKISIKIGESCLIIFLTIIMSQCRRYLSSVFHYQSSKCRIQPDIPPIFLTGHIIVNGWHHRSSHRFHIFVTCALISWCFILPSFFKFHLFHTIIDINIHKE